MGVALARGGGGPISEFNAVPFRCGFINFPLCHFPRCNVQQMEYSEKGLLNGSRAVDGRVCLRCCIRAIRARCRREGSKACHPFSQIVPCCMCIRHLAPQQGCASVRFTFNQHQSRLRHATNMRPTKKNSSALVRAKRLMGTDATLPCPPIPRQCNATTFPLMSKPLWYGNHLAVQKGGRGGGGNGPRSGAANLAATATSRAADPPR